MQEHGFGATPSTGQRAIDGVVLANATGRVDANVLAAGPQRTPPRVAIRCDEEPSARPGLIAQPLARQAKRSPVGVDAREEGVAERGVSLERGGDA